MSRKQILNTILFLLAVLIWVMVYHTIYSGPNPSETRIVTGLEDSSFSNRIPLFQDTLIHLRKDPFYHFPQKPAKKKRIVRVEQKIDSQESIPFPYQIDAIGKIRDARGIMLLIRIDNRELIVRKNDTINDFIIHDLSDSLLTVRFHKRFYSFRIP